MGFVAIHDSFFDGWTWSLPAGQMKVLLYCIRRARWKKGKPDRWCTATSEYEIPRGSFLGSIRTIAEDCDVSKWTAHQAILAGQRDGMITVQKHGRNLSLVTLCNYADYQDVDDGDRTENRTLTGRFPDIEEPRNQRAKEKEEAKKAPTTLDSLAKDALPWSQLSTWFVDNLFWWEHIPKPDQFASKLCVEGLNVRGIPWPSLQEKFLGSSAYLEANQKKYKPAGARAFYWNQMERYRNLPPPDPKPGKRDAFKKSEPTRLGDVDPLGWTAEELEAARRAGRG